MNDAYQVWRECEEPGARLIDNRWGYVLPYHKRHYAWLRWRKIEVASKPFDLDGTEHSDDDGICTSSCRKRRCKTCGGWVHYQPIYGGYLERCAKACT